MTVGLADTKGYSRMEHTTGFVDRGPFEMVPHWLLFDKDVSALGLRVYLILRQHADSRGTCFPGRQRLAELVGASLPTLDRAREQLVRAGAMCMGKRVAVNGKPTSCLYHVHWERAIACEALTRFFAEGSKDFYTLTNTHLTHTSTLIRNPEGLRTHEALQQMSASNALEVAHSTRTTRKRRKRAYSADFDAFWEAYPRKAAKRAAFVAFEGALESVSLDELIAAAKRLSADPNREQRYTPYPATWLRQERWLDDAQPASVTVRTGGQRRMQDYARMYENLKTGELEQ